MYGMMVLSKGPSCQHQQEVRVQQQGVVGYQLQKTYVLSTTNAGNDTAKQMLFVDQMIGDNEKRTLYTRLGGGYFAIVCKVFVLNGKKIFGSLSRMLEKSQKVISSLVSTKLVNMRTVMLYGSLGQKVLMKLVKIMLLDNVSGEPIISERQNLQSSKVHMASLLTTTKLFSKIKTMLAQFVMVKKDQYKQMANHSAWQLIIATPQKKFVDFSVRTAIEGLDFSKTAFCGYAPQSII